MATTSERVKSTTTEARNLAEQTQRTVLGAVRDSAYLSIGVGDYAVSLVRNLNEKAVELRSELSDEAPVQIRKALDPREVRPRVEHGVQVVRDRTTELTARGRGLVEGVQRSSTTRRAADQVGTARSQVKAAATSVSKATRLVGTAAEESVERIGDDSPVDYSDKNITELREMAREADIPGRSGMNRDELVAALEAL